MPDFLVYPILILSMARQRSVYHSHQSLFLRFGTIAKPMFKMFKKPYQILIGGKILNLFLLIPRFTFLMKHYETFLETISQIKKNKSNYRLIPWMTDDVKIYLKKRSKLTKRYYKNGQQKNDYDKVLGKSTDCSKKILKLKMITLIK